MEIHALKVLFTEQDVNGLIAKGMGSNRHMEVRDLRVRLAAEGVYVAGTYEMRIVDLPFESLWQLSVLQGKLAARLATFQPLGSLAGKALGLTGFFKKGSLSTLLMQALADALRPNEAFQVDGDTLLCDLDRLLTDQGFVARTRLTAVRCDAGNLVIEAGTAPS